MGATVATVVGREEELRVARAALRGSASVALVFRGEPGIGKTALWEAAVEAARADGRRVLEGRPVEAERRLGLAALADLIEPVAEEVLPELPAPQRRALEAALLLAEPDVGAPDGRTLGAALLGSLRVVGGDRGAVLAVDDLQWIDAASRPIVEFALRRLSAVRGSAVLAVRAGEANDALPVFDHRTNSLAVDVGPLSFGALQRLIVDRLGVALSRPLTRRVHAVSGGNPLYALEIARALQDRESPVAPDEELPVPRDLDGIVRERIRTLSPSSRWALAAAAALAAPHVELIEAEGELQPALDAAIVRVEGGVVRFEHPLLASAAYALLAPSRRRELHERLAGLVDDVEQRARHLALARPGADEAVAATLEVAAERAIVRGAPAAAAELLELAVARTSTPERLAARKVAAARAYFRAGELGAADALLEQAIPELAPSAERARALALAAWVHRGELPIASGLAEQAWKEAQGDQATEAMTAVAVSFTGLLGGAPSRGRDYARFALDRLDALAGEEFVAVVAQAAFAELMTTGRVDPELLARGLAAEERLGWRGEGVEVRVVLALQLMLEERYGDAREEFSKLINQLEAAGHEQRLADTIGFLSQLETRAGRPALAKTIAVRGAEIDEAIDMPEHRVAIGGMHRAWAATYLGHLDEARRLTAAGLTAAAKASDPPAGWHHAAVLGFLEFSLGNAEAAVLVLAPVAEGLAVLVPDVHPALFQVLPNLIESLVALGRLDEALPCLERLEQRGRALDSAWALSQAARARGLIAAAHGDMPGALACFESALREHARVEAPFERGRTLLARGAVLRRERRWGATRESLTAAVAIFEQVEAPLWIEKARSELARVGGRRSAGGLTPAEKRIAQLVAAGYSNKQIASQLFVTVRTVETHLTKVYSKLDVHSRAGLARRFPA